MKLTTKIMAVATGVLLCGSSMAGIVATYDWSNYTADDWTGHIEQTVSGMTLNGDGRVFAQGAGQMAFQTPFTQPEVGTFTITDAGSVAKNFTVQSVDLGASTENTTFVGTLLGAEQWTITVPVAASTTFTVPDAGVFTEVDSITWTSAGTAWGNVMDNMTVDVVPEPATFGLIAVFGGAVLFIRRSFMI